MSQDALSQLFKDYLQVLTNIPITLLLLLGILTLVNSAAKIPTPLESISSSLGSYSTEKHPSFILTIVSSLKKLVDWILPYQLVGFHFVLYLVVYFVDHSLLSFILSFILALYSYLVKLDLLLNFILSQLYWVNVSSDKTSVKLLTTLFIAFILFDFSVLKKYL